MTVRRISKSVSRKVAEFMKAVAIVDTVLMTLHWSTCYDKPPLHPPASATRPHNRYGSQQCFPRCIHSLISFSVLLSVMELTSASAADEKY